MVIVGRVMLVIMVLLVTVVQGMLVPEPTY